MRKLNLLSMCFVLMVMLSCNHKPKASVIVANADSLSETIMNTAPSSNARTFVNRKDTGELIVFTPIYNTVDLVCGKRPSKDTDMSVVYCAEAAFTGECLDSFAHRNVAGNHVSGGILYRGYVAKTNTGAFVWYQGKWKFLYDSYASELRKAEKHRGMGFGQNMIIYNGRVMPRFRKDKPLNIYRALCEQDGKLCIVESKQALAYSEFVEKLANLKVIRYGIRMELFVVS